MANNPLLEEFATAHPGNLQRRLTDAFDGLVPLTQDDEAAVVQLKTELDAVLQERINALGQD
jgi:hypothetical protein